MRTCCLFLLAISYSLSSHGAVVLGLASPPPSGVDEQVATHLFQIGLDGTDYADLGPIEINGGPAEFDGLAANSEGHVFAFQVTPAGSRLVSVDPTLGVATLLSPPLFGREVRGATSGAGDELWAIDSAVNELMLVSMITGEELSAVALTLDNQPFDLPAQSDLAIDFSGELILAANNQFFSLDQLSGELTLLASDNAGELNPPSEQPPTLLGAVVGMAPTERLVGLDGQGIMADDIYAYDLANGFERSLFAAAPFAFDIALGDLALLHQPVSSGDYNGDGQVNLADYTVWRDSLGSTTNLAANGNDFGTSMNRIDAADYLVWKANFGSSVPLVGSVATAQVVPEPSALSLALWCGGLVLGSASLRRCRRRQVWV